jgi:protein-S-isoprenylcysteine O-methyltransferase Ste14
MSIWPIIILWLALVVVWMTAAPRTKEVERAESLSSRRIHLGLLITATVLLGLPLLNANLVPWRLFSRPEIAYWSGVLVQAAGVSFAIWARLSLGIDWSGPITIKAGQRLIRRGPYAVVRHPIYTGIATGFLGTAIALNRLVGLLAVVLVVLAYLRKIQIEERWLVESFGEAYTQYRQKVKALIPYLL